MGMPVRPGRGQGQARQIRVQALERPGSRFSRAGEPNSPRARQIGSGTLNDGDELNFRAQPSGTQPLAVLRSPIDHNRSNEDRHDVRATWASG